MDTVATVTDARQISAGDSCGESAPSKIDVRDNARDARRKKRKGANTKHCCRHKERTHDLKTHARLTCVAAVMDFAGSLLVPSPLVYLERWKKGMNANCLP